MAALLYELLMQQDHFAPGWKRKQCPDLTLPHRDLCGAQNLGLGGQFREMVRHPGLWRLTVQVHVLGPHLPAV